MLTAESLSTISKKCSDCSQQALPDEAFCERCKATRTSRRLRLREEHRCVSCKKEIRGTGRCKQCQLACNARQKELRAAKRAAGQCPCGRGPLSLKNRTYCRQCVLEQTVINKRRMRAFREQGLCACGRPPSEPGTKCCVACKQREKGRREAERRRVFAHYGLVCACPGCNEATYEFLEIDHIAGDGAAHRRSLGLTTIYRWLIRNNFPPGFQTLCSNCNRAKFRYGRCPHQRGT